MKKRRFFGILFAACGAFGAAKLLKLLWNRVLVWILTKQTVNTEAASIGIIGGADGPTAVFVTTSGSPFFHWILPLILLIIGIWGILWLYRRKAKE